MKIEQQKLILSLIGEDMLTHAKMSNDPLHKKSMERLELLNATLKAFNEIITSYCSAEEEEDYWYEGFEEEDLELIDDGFFLVD